MNRPNRQACRSIPGLVLILMVALLSLFVVPVSLKAAEGDFNETIQAESVPLPAAVTYRNYSGLAELVTMICDDALERFRGFYGGSVVTVTPFTTIGLYEQNRQSELGVTLADQMTATINNETKDHLGLARGATPQKLQGVLQEVDGYLRIHISGVNAAGQRTSYVVTVEMSEPIYRAMHTYL